MMLKQILHLVAAVMLLGVLSACDSVEERVGKHFQKGAEFYQAGDLARAIIELRNVFKLNGAHFEARMLMARIEEDRDNPTGAYNQYLVVTESHPNSLEAQRAAATLAANLGEWEVAKRHAKAARALIAKGQVDPVIRAVELVLAYQEARRDRNSAAARSISGQAAGLLKDNPELLLARRILIDDRVFQQNWEAALAELNAGLAQDPDERLFYGLRLAVLEQLGRSGAIEAQLRDMVSRFPDDENLRRTLIRWYVSQERTDDAEYFLRNQIELVGAAAEARMTLVAFLHQVRGPEVALEEIEKILARAAAEDNADRALYRAARAGLLFDLGNRQSAVAELHDILKSEEPSQWTPRIQIALARILAATSNPVGARVLVEEVLAGDATNVEALKMRATWMIEDDRPDEALVELRRALDQAPRDAEVFTMMSRAQERAGSRELVGEMLSLAVEVSNNAPEESLRYATYLVQYNRLLPAEGVLVDALRLQPGHLGILNMLGGIYVRLEDWGRAQGVVDTLTLSSSEEAVALANELSVRILAGRNQQAELLTFLERLAANPQGNNHAVVLAIRLRLAEGDLQGALEFLGSHLADFPDDPDMRFISAGLLAAEGKSEEARGVLRTLLGEHPQSERLWLALYNLHRSLGEAKMADAVLAEALAAIPESPNLNWALAAELEHQGDIEGAIAIYERLYERDSNSTVIANNLASLISSFREDEESLQRAYAIARRLHGTQVAPFQDTYGWIAARLGNYEEALDYLEPAAQALPDDPVVRYHLAHTYALAGQEDKALKAYRATQELIETGRHLLPFRDEVTKEIARLQAAEGPAED